MKIAVINPITRTPTKHIVPQIDSNKDAMIVKLALEMQALGHEIVLFVSDLYKPVNEENLDLEVVYLKTYIRGMPEIPFAPSLIGRLRNQYDVVLTSEAFQWTTVFAVLARLLSWKRKPKIYVWQELSVHQRVLRRLPSIFFHRIILRFFLDWQIFRYVPRGMRAKHFLNQQGIKNNRFISCIPHGVDQRVFFHQTSTPPRKYILSPARLVADKGIDTLLRAFRVTRDEGIDVDLIIQGDGPDLALYENMAREMEIDKFVYFNRARVNHAGMRKLYSEAVFTVIASRRDFMLFSIMESLACETPVIVSDAVDISEEIAEYGGGLVFTCDDYVMLAKQMIDFLIDQSAATEIKKRVIQAASRYKNNNIAREFINEFKKNSFARNKK
ncbi:MAG: glycosyltransferase family 4 protein [Methylotenera sp.]|nr:glycosyltransferase family 4 protein [Methylotenera sp.]